VPNYYRKLTKPKHYDLIDQVLPFPSKIIIRRQLLPNKIDFKLQNIKKAASILEQLF